MKKGVWPKEPFPRDPMELAYMAEEALRLAVYEAIQDHAKSGDPVAIWKNGKVVWISARKLKLRRPRLKYRPHLLK